MKTALKFAAVAIGGLLALAAAAAATLWLNSERLLHRVVVVQVAAVPYATDPGAASRGRYLYASRGCQSCHGEDGAGRVFINHPNGLFARSANLTTGAGSAVAGYTERDWVRAIRHGVKPDGRPLFVMPSEDYNRFTDADLADLVAHVRALPARAAPGAEVRLPFVVRLAHGAGMLRDAAQKIDHTQPPSQPVPVGVSVAHGHYVAQTCIGCHGAQLAGGRIAGAPPEWPPAADLRSADGALARYPDPEPFKRVLRTGKRPDGTVVNRAMPRNTHMNDTDLEALFLYLKSTPAPTH